MNPLVAAVLMPLSRGVIISGGVPRGARRAEGRGLTAIIILLPVVLILGAVFAGLLVYAARSGQVDDPDDPPERILHDQIRLSDPAARPLAGAELLQLSLHLIRERAESEIPAGQLDLRTP
jgi:cbb3-type cytochrome oxidase maturation protein